MSRDVERQPTKKVAYVWPIDIIEAMRTLARQHQRSLNGEIIFALREYIARHQVEHNQADVNKAC